MLTRILIILGVVILAAVFFFLGYDTEIGKILGIILGILVGFSPIWLALLVRKLWDSDSKIFRIIGVVVFVIMIIVGHQLYDRKN